MELPLTEQNKIDLKMQHRQTKEKRNADRIKIITMLDKGFSEIQISEILMLDEETVRNWYKKFIMSKTIGEFLNFKYVSYEGRLNEEQIIMVRQYIVDNIIIDSKQIISFIKEKFIECNSGRVRLNLNGAYDPLTNKVITEESEKMQFSTSLKTLIL